ncbi:MAG: hypothetical protein CMJ18_07615 [Phycisphaeraceae bacterium]|nr:hypothetical protein [Phycisphaeraceae bacterium]
MKDDPTAWMDQAPCVNDSRFLAVDNPVNIQDAQTICLTRCPVYTECRAFRDSDPNGDLHEFEGIWAGDLYDPAAKRRERNRAARHNARGAYSDRMRENEARPTCVNGHSREDHAYISETTGRIVCRICRNIQSVASTKRAREKAGDSDAA